MIINVASLPGGRRAALLLFVWTAAACAGAPASESATESAPRPAPAGAVADRCAVPVPSSAELPSVSAPAGDAHSTDLPISVGASGALDPAHAPVPRTPAERLVFSHLYETLVRIDCGGQTVPALAESWRAEDGGADGPSAYAARTWTFRVADGHADWSGAPVTAHTVAASLTRSGQGFPAQSAYMPGIEKVVVDARSLTVTLSFAASVQTFARAELAVVTGTRSDGWPIGTGAYRPVEGTLAAAGAAGTPILRLAGPVALEVRPLPPDARDALDAGVDLFVTADPAVIDYAALSSRYAAVSFTWDRTYVLLAPVGAPRPDSTRTDARPDPALLPIPLSWRSALARDAVPIDARAPELLDCEIGLPVARITRASAVRARRIVYPASDAVARALAERLVALVLPPVDAESAWLAQRLPELATGGRASAVGLVDDAFYASLRVGRDAAYVVPMERGPWENCAPLQRVAELAPWQFGPPSVETQRGPTWLHLIDTRSTLVLRNGVEGVSMDGSGILRLERVRRAEPTP